MIDDKIPVLRLSEKRDDTKPTTDGPEQQPKSPPSASRANIAVELLGSDFAESENVPGHIIHTLKPHSAQPISDNTGVGESEIKRYEAMQSTVEAVIAFDISNLSPNFP